MNALTSNPNTKLQPVNTQCQFGYYAELSRLSNTSDLKHRITAIIKRLGFSHYTYNYLSRGGSCQTELNTLPEQLINRYLNSGYYEHDMNLQKARQETRPFFHSTIYDYVARAPFKSDMTCCMHDIHTLNKEFGFFDFYSIPIITTKNSEHAMLTVTRQGANPIDLKQAIGECESDLLLLCEAVDFITGEFFYDCFFSNQSQQSTILNPKPLRVLDTLANSDLTINQIADKLCISVVTANQHLKTVRKTLGTQTNYAAIRQGVLKNLIRLKTDKKYQSPPSY